MNHVIRTSFDTVTTLITFRWVECNSVSQLTNDGSRSVSSKAGQHIPVLVTTRIASVGHLFAHAPMKSHFSTSLPIPSASTGAPSPHSTSISNASTGQRFTHKPHAAQTLGIATVKLALFAAMKSPGHASTQVLHPIHLAESKVKDLISNEYCVPRTGL